MRRCVRREATEGGQDLDSNPLDFQMQRQPFQLFALLSAGFGLASTRSFGGRVRAKLASVRSPGDSILARAITFGFSIGRLTVGPETETCLI